MQLFNSIDQTRHTAIYVRILTVSQKTDRQQEELTSYAELYQLNFNRNLDVFIDVVSGFKDGEDDQLAKDRGMVSEFSPYEFKVEKE